MGKGDKKSKRGKIVKGTYGASRPRKERNRKSGPKNKLKGAKSTKK